MNDAPAQKRRRVEVLCLTYGEPPLPDFLPQYHYSLSILNRLTRRVAPIPEFITPLLAARRALMRREAFTESGYRSPLEEITRRQVAALGNALARARRGVDFNVRMVCEFRPPMLQESLAQLAKSPPDDIVILPVYLAESDFTWGISRTDCAQFHRAQAGHNPLPAPRFLVGFGFDEELAEAIAAFVWRRVQAAGWDGAKCRRSALILGAHGTLQFPPPGINGGGRETLFFFGLLRKHLKPHFRTVRVGWLNHKVGGQWTFPEVRESAQECWDAGDRSVVYFPFGFLADNAESQVEGPIQLADFKWEDLLHIDCPNDDAGFIGVMAQRVLERLDGPPGSWERVEEGTARLIQKERTPVRGTPGWFRFHARGLAIAAAIFWFGVGMMLTVRGALMGVHFLTEIESALACAFGAYVGWWKGTRILAKMARRNLLRVRRLPQPSPLHHMFSNETWWLVLFFMMLGMGIRFSPLPYGVRSAVLLAVGLAMLVGAATYVKGAPAFVTPSSPRPVPDT